MKKKSQDMKLVEEAFSSIKFRPKTNHASDIEIVERVLSRNYDIKAHINIVDNTGQPFFGMSVYPAEDVIDKMVDSLVTGTNRIQVVEEIWAKNKNWVIDIDSQLLYDSSLNANPYEITAVLLHEIGHTVQSNAVPNRVGRVLKFANMSAPINVKKVLRWTKARKILGLVFIEACSSTNFVKAANSEAEADTLAVKEGYGEDLSNFIDKLIRCKGNAKINLTEKQLENEIEPIVQWSLVNISQLEYRKNILDRNIKGQMLRTNSPFIKTYLKNVRGIFFGKSEDRLQQMVAEQYTMKEYKKYTATMEAFRDLFNKQGRIQKITTQDIDMIIIEANRIQNENDRIYVLDLIYNKLDIIELSMDLLTNSDTAAKVQVTKETLKRQKEELMNLRRQVMSIKVRKQDITFNVSYPIGYEG